MASTIYSRGQGPSSLQTLHESVHGVPLNPNQEKIRQKNPAFSSRFTPQEDHITSYIIIHLAGRSDFSSVQHIIMAPAPVQALFPLTLIIPLINVMSNKLAFQVVACSGEDPNYPASQLNIHSASTSGYRSKQYCEFPVEIGFQLTEGECFINQIQILSHQSCIASKIELYVGKGSSYAQAEFKKLGYLSLSTNENSGFKARELKSIYIETSTQFLKFLLLKNHNNGLNLYSQVGIVAINVLGTAQANNGDIINPSDGGAAMPSLKKKQSDDLAFDMHFDKETAEKIRKVHAAKDRAVEEEDYDQVCSCFLRYKIG